MLFLLILLCFYTTLFPFNIVVCICNTLLWHGTECKSTNTSWSLHVFGYNHIVPVHYIDIWECFVGQLCKRFYKKMKMKLESRDNPQRLFL